MICGYWFVFLFLIFPIIIFHKLPLTKVSFFCVSFFTMPTSQNNQVDERVGKVRCHLPEVMFYLPSFFPSPFSSSSSPCSPSSFSSSSLSQTPPVPFLSGGTIIYKTSLEFICFLGGWKRDRQREQLEEEEGDDEEEDEDEENLWREVPLLMEVE